MNLDETNRKKIADWIAEGLKISEIQKRISTELKLTMTYMDVRLLVDDLKLTPKDPEPLKTNTPAQAAIADSTRKTTTAAPASGAVVPGEEEKAESGGVSVSVDQLARPGALVSGKVTFSDGNRAEWYLDQSGRLGLAAQQQGYRPPQSDLAQFQAKLESELSKLGF